MEERISLHDYFTASLANVGGPFRGRVSIPGDKSKAGVIERSLDSFFLSAEDISDLEYIFSGISYDHGPFNKTIRSGDIYCSGENVYVMLGRNAAGGSYVLVSVAGESKGSVMRADVADVFNMPRLGYVF